MTSSVSDLPSSSSYAISLWRDVDSLMNLIMPSRQSNEMRDAVATFIRQSLRKQKSGTGRQHSCYDGDSCGDDETISSPPIHSISSAQDILLMISGSCCSKTYLPDGDLDLVLITSSFTSNVSDMQDLSFVFSALCEEIYRKEQDLKTQQQLLYQQPTGGPSNHKRPIDSEFTVRNIEFINARTKLLHCVVDAYSVDVTINQIGVIASMLFLEEVDREIGEEHLFKRSIMLIKSWCLHESRLYCGVPILGGKEGMLSSYAISIMVMHLFNLHRDLHHPLQVLRLFLNHYQRFPWENNVLTLEGPYPIQTGPTASSGSNNQQSMAATDSAANSTKYHRCSNRLYPILERLSKTLQEIAPSINESLLAKKKTANPPIRFTFRVCNIQDPVDDTNNLGYSVTRNNMALIDRALQIGASRLESLFSPSIGLPPPSPSQQHFSHQQGIAHNINNPNHYPATNGSHAYSSARESPSYHIIHNSNSNSSNGNAQIPPPYYPFPTIPNSNGGGIAITASPRAFVPPPVIPPPLSVPTSSNSTNSNHSSVLPNYTQHPIESFFALSLQHYAHNQLIQTSSEVVRRNSFSSNTSAKGASTQTNKSTSDVSASESCSVTDDPLAMNREMLYTWLRLAEEKAVLAKKQIPPTVSKSSDKAASSLAVNQSSMSIQQLLLSSETDSLAGSATTPVDIRPIDVSSQHQYHLQRDGVNTKDKDSKVILRSINPSTPLPVRPDNKETTSNSKNRLINSGQQRIQGSDEARGLDDSSDTSGSEDNGNHRRARSPSPASSTCSSLSSAITTAADSLDHSPGHVQTRPDSLSPTDELLFQIQDHHQLNANPLDTSLDTVHRRKHSRSTSSPSPDSSEGTSHDSGESLLPAVAHQLHDKSVSSTVIHVSSVRNTESVLPPLAPNTHKQQQPQGKKVNNKNAKKGANSSQVSQQQQLPKPVQNAAAVALNSSHVRGRSDSVRSQSSVMSTLSREEKGESNSSSSSSGIDRTLTESKNTSWKWIIHHLPFSHLFTSTKSSMTPAAALRAAERRSSQQQQASHRRHLRTWTALGVAVAVLAGIVALHRTNSRIVTGESSAQSKAKSAIAGNGSGSSSAQTSSGSSESSSSSGASSSSIMRMLGQDPQASLARLLNLSTSIVQDKTEMLEKANSETTTSVEDMAEAVETTTLDTVATHWVQVGDSLIFGRDLSDELNKKPVVSAAASPLGSKGSSSSTLSNGNEPPVISESSSSSAVTTSMQGNAEDDTLISSTKDKEVSNTNRKKGKSARKTVYLWTKDHSPVSLSTQPLLTIAQTVLGDSGHYRCYALSSLYHTRLSSTPKHTDIGTMSDFWQALAALSVVASFQKDTNQNQKYNNNLPTHQQKQASSHLRSKTASSASSITTADDGPEIDWENIWEQLPVSATVISPAMLPALLAQSASLWQWSEIVLQHWLSTPLTAQSLTLTQQPFSLVAETHISISKKPRVRNRPFYQEIKKGRPFFLPLDVEAVPAATFQWYKNGYPLSDQRAAVLVLDDVDFSATGTYSCEVTNVAGHMLWLEATLHVTE